MIADHNAVHASESCYPRSSSDRWKESKRKCREIRESPSMMWKRSIVQGCEPRRRGSGGAPAALALALVLVAARGCCGADLVIEIPGSGGAAGGRYRLDYRPAEGAPAPNYTVAARASTINFTGLPGTHYHFMLYYSNDTFADLLTWNQTILTAPEPPTNLSVSLGRNKQATISWAPPAHGDYTGFRFKVVPLTERAEGGARNITVEDRDAAGNWTLALRDLSPGATYQLHAFTLLHDKDSAAYASRNFTTKPNTPGKFIVWFRNETTLLVLWQPPYPPGFYTHYKVSIVPADARESELYVEKEGEPPGPAQAAFKGLVPGRAYNISVQTVSEPEISAPTTAQYRTVPLRPRNVTAPARWLSESGFRVTWLPPAEPSEFDKYQVSVSGEARRLAPAVRARQDEPAAAFEGLEPGARYTVTVKTMSGKVTSWPATADLTLKPLPVRGLAVARAAGGALRVSWAPAEGSLQDEFRVEYHEAEARDDASARSVPAAAAEVTLDALLPGRNYSVAVRAVSRGVASNETTASGATRPLPPAVLEATPAARALRLAWRSDVDSRQDEYRVRYARHPPRDDAWRTVSTVETSVTLEDLFPGALYEVQLAAVSHSLLSENHTLLKPVRPLPARSLVVQRATSNSVAVEWAGPARGASALQHYTVRYRTLSQSAWSALPPPDALATRAEIANMTHGERYVIEVDTASEGADSVGSGAPLRAEHTVRPAPVSNVAQLPDTHNVTLEWPRAHGRVDSYLLEWTDGAGSARSAAVPDPGAGGSVRAVVPALQPGEGYSITITASSYNLTSDQFTMETRTRPLIQSEMTIVNEPEDDDESAPPPSILVTYTPTPSSVTAFDSYRFRLEAGEEGGGAAQQAERAADEPARRVPFRRLVPGALYNVTMWTVSRNVTSHPVQRAARLFPRAVPALSATAAGARRVELAWPRPAGLYSDFEVQYLAAADTLRTHTTRATRLALDGLRPHTLYTFTVVVRAGAAAALRTVSRAVSAAVATAQAPPPAPRRFHPQDAQPSRLTFAWELPPDEANGELARFVLSYWEREAPARVRTLEFGGEARTAAVQGLRPGATYEFRLAGETGGGRGEPASWTQHMAIAAPPRPAADALPAPARASPTTVAVRFRADYFSPANGNVTAYTLVVGEEPREDTPARLPAWRDVQRLPRWPPYQVTEPYLPFRADGPREEEFTIGSERCEPGQGRAYCNGPLKPNTRYYVKLRAFTAPDKFTDTAYTEVHTGGQHGVDRGRVRGAGGARAGWRRGAGAPAAARARPGRRRAARAAHLAPRARGRLPRPLPAHVGRLRLPVQRRVRGAEGRGARRAVHGRRPAREPAQEPVHQHPAVRPLALQAAARGRRGGLRLHQRELRAGARLAARVHRHAGPAALHARRLLAHGVGVGLARDRDADALRGEGPREVRPLLAVRHAARVLRRHRRHGAQREPLPRLDRHRASAVSRRRAARAQALPLHHVARLRRARPAHGARALRARLPRALPARCAPRRRALQRWRRPLRHLHHSRHGATTAGARRGLAGHLRHGARHAARARLDGADGAAVHLHPPVPRGRAGGTGPGAAAAQPPPQPRLRRRRGHRGVRHVGAAAAPADERAGGRARRRTSAPAGAAPRLIDIRVCWREDAGCRVLVSSNRN